MRAQVLIVEDNPLNRELLRDWLEVESYAVRTATDLQSSYDALSERPPDVVLLDINLGSESGLDLVKWMRDRPETREVPVIAVTAHALKAEQQEIMASGCRACLSKPIDFRLLKEELDRCLQPSKAKQSDS